MAGFKSEIENRLLLARLLAVFYVIVFPILILLMMFDPRFDWRQVTGFKVNFLIFLIALVYAALAPLVTPAIERGMIKKYLKSSSQKQKPHNLVFNIANSKMAFACGVFTFAMLVFWFSHNTTWALCFYPVGLFWALKLWPRRRHFEQYLQRIESHASITS
ncbi:MAG: hypothetical protein JSW34_12945 [Candidatus Zixiibacteriota bacterium]|nr:MAG: hypothetical protein JSW34_12945 [candidate division Zixibacteria bacterium]